MKQALTLLMTFLLAVVFTNSQAQVQIDQPVQLTGTTTTTRAVQNLALPVNGTDAANKDYVDAAVAAAGGSTPAWSHFAQYPTSGSTFTVPAGVTLIKVQVWGAGGGGVPDANGSGGGGGGGAGGYTEGTFTVTPNTTYTVTVGTGGAKSTSVSAAGTDGNSSSFVGTGINLVATGGKGAPVPVLTAKGGMGGIGSGGYINTTLGSGGDAGYSNVPGQPGTNGGGSGGGSYSGAGGGGGGGGIGGGNGAGPNQNGSDALPNTGGGGGGGGGTTNFTTAGGNGADGQVVVFW